MHQLIPLTDFQKSALTGSMLGDGHIALGKSNSSASYMVARAIKDYKYLQYEIDIFSNFVKSKAPKLYNKGECCFATIFTPSFLEYKSKWYNPIKIVPKDLILDPISISHWIADDGHISLNKLKYRFVIELSTHGFKEDDVSFLASLLQERYNEKFLVKKKNKNDKSYFIIKAYDSACRALFKDINDPFAMKRKRIWDDEESLFHTHQPPRQREAVTNLENRKSLLKSIIDNEKSIGLKDLANKLGYVYNGITDYKSVNKLIKPYLDSKFLIKIVDKNNNNTCTLVKEDT